MSNTAPDLASFGLLLRLALFKNAHTGSRVRAASLAPRAPVWWSMVRCDAIRWANARLRCGAGQCSALRCAVALCCGAVPRRAELHSVWCRIMCAHPGSRHRARAFMCACLCARACAHACAGVCAVACVCARACTRATVHARTHTSTGGVVPHLGVAATLATAGLACMLHACCSMLHVSCTQAYVYGLHT